MDVTQITQVVTFDDFTRQHMAWLILALPIIWAAIAGAGVRLLLVRSEPLLVRFQNAMAGILLAITLSDITAHLFTTGDYANGYAVIYGMVGRELFVTLYEFVSTKAAPFLLDLVRFFFPFAFKDDDKAKGHDDK